MYNLILRGWLAGKFTAQKIDLFVHVGYITEAEGQIIKAS